MKEAKENLVSLTWDQVKFLCEKGILDFYIVDFPVRKLLPVNNLSDVENHHYHGGKFEIEKSKFDLVFGEEIKESVQKNNVQNRLKHKR